MFLRSLFFALVLVTGGCVSTPRLSKPFEALGSDDNALRERARTELKASLAEATAPGAQGDAAQALEAKVIAQIDSALPLSERLYLIRLLELFGGEASLEVLSGYLHSDEPEVRDSARRALSSIPAPQAADRLLEALREGTPADRRALIDMLVYRDDSRAVALITKSLQSDDAGLVEASAIALGKLGARESIPALRAARANVESRYLPVVEGALLDMGVDANLALELAESGSNAAIRSGAYQILLAQNPDSAQSVLHAALADENFPGRARILKESLVHGDVETQRALVGRLSSMPMNDQLTVVEAIGAAGLSQFEEPLLQLLPSADETLKGVLIDVLSQIGGDASYESVYQAFVQSPNDRLVAQAIASLRSDSGDAMALEKARAGGDSADALTAIKVLALRNSPGATDLLNSIVAQPGEAARREEAMKALESIGNLESVRVLVGVVMAQDPSMRRAQLSLKRLSIGFNSPAVLWTGVYQPALENAVNDDVREGLVVILDGISCEGALAYLRPFIQDASAALHPAALRALTRWSDAGAGDVWIEDVLLQDTSEEEVKMAERALIRLLSNEDIQGDPVDKLNLALRAVQTTKNAEFKRALIGTYDRSLDWRELRAIKDVFAPLLDDAEVSDLVQKIFPK